MQRWIERISWILLTGLLFFLWNTADRDSQQMSHLLEDQNSRMEHQTSQFDSLMSVIQAVSTGEDSALRKDLMSKPSAITVPGVLGGTMRIHSETDIRILNDSWAYAQFDDGHIQAAGLFSYVRNPDGTVTWKLIESKVY